MNRVQKLENCFIKSDVIEFQASHNRISSLVFSNDSKRLCTTSGNQIKISSVEKHPRDLYSLSGHSGIIYRAEWDPEHQEKLFSISTDKTCRFWDLRASKGAYQTVKMEGEVLNCSWSPDGRVIAVSDDADTISFIDPRFGSGRNASVINTIKHDEFVFGLTWDWQSDIFCRTMGDGTVHFLKYPSLEVVYVLTAHTASCLSISRDPKGRYFATGGGDAITCIWDQHTWLCKAIVSRLQ